MRHQLHGHRQGRPTHLDLFDNLMELEVADHQHVALPDEAQVQSQVCLREHALALVQGVHFIVDQVALRH